MHGSYDMHDVQVSSIKVTFNSAIRNVLTNLKSNTIEERILLVEELSLNYFVSRIPDHPKWPREMIAIEIPKGIFIGPCTDDGLISIVDWYSVWKANVDGLVGIKRGSTAATTTTTTTTTTNNTTTTTTTTGAIPRHSNARRASYRSASGSFVGT